MSIKVVTLQSRPIGSVKQIRNKKKIHNKKLNPSHFSFPLCSFHRGPPLLRAPVVGHRPETDDRSDPGPRGLAGFMLLPH